jgi:hypothetical protein
VCTLDDLSLIKASICMSPRLDANIKLMIKSIVKEPTNRPAIKINISSPPINMGHNSQEGIIFGNWLA